MAEKRNQHGWFSRFVSVACLIPAVVVFSVDLCAATRFWTLTDVRFDDGAIATGYFSYDDVTHEVATWDVRVSEGLRFISFNYLPSNSQSYTSSGADFYFGSSFQQPNGKVRAIELNPLTKLEGSSAAVSLYLSPDPRYSVESVSDGFFASAVRLITAGSLVLMPVPPAVTPRIVFVIVDEFYNQGLRHYFITADAADKHDLDTGVHPGWVRTGESFRAHATNANTSAPIYPVCRYYGDPSVGIDSHFYSADPAECDAVRLKYPNDWRLETDNAFKINLPNMATGDCPSGTIPVYRVWNRRRDSNHRYTTHMAIKDEMIGIGYIAEGYGPNGVAMCAVQ